MGHQQTVEPDQIQQNTASDPVFTLCFQIVLLKLKLE